jgi:hypothetical protein
MILARGLQLTRDRALSSMKLVSVDKLVFLFKWLSWKQFSNSHYLKVGVNYTKHTHMSKGELLDFCKEETTIECHQCHIEARENTDALNAIDDFFDSGWRVIKGKCMCPACVNGGRIVKGTYTK